MSLRAPIAIPVEIRTEMRRVFRLAWNVGEDGLRLAAPLPFEPGRPIEARFRLPDGEGLALRARVESDGDEEERDRPRELTFLDPPSEARLALRRYVQVRLELPA